MKALQLSESQPLPSEEKQELRKSAKIIFQHLEDVSKQQQQEDPTTIPSWIRNNGNHDDCDNSNDSSAYLKERSFTCHYFDMYGFCVQSNFCSQSEIQQMKQEMKALVEENWHPGSKESIDSFGTDAKSNTARGDYFLDSADRVSYFAEPQAIDAGTGKIKEQYQEDKMSALNKVGHGMHTVRGSAFYDYTTSQKLNAFVKELGWEYPVIPQSMYIFKQPTIGGTVHSHQDSTFLYTTPKQSCLGLWLALDDATLDNGCLWVRPQSHYEPVRRQFIRNPKYDFNSPQNNDDNNNSNDTDNSSSKIPKLIFENRNPTPSHVYWEGTLPESVQLLEKDDIGSDEIFDSSLLFVPVEVKAGDLVVFCGTLDHFSLPNFSSLPRHTFQLHLVEGPKANVEWSSQNWLQYQNGKSFLELSPASTIMKKQ